VKGPALEVGRSSRQQGASSTEPLARQQVRRRSLAHRAGPAAGGGCRAGREPQLARRRSAAFEQVFQRHHRLNRLSRWPEGCCARRRPPADSSKQIGLSMGRVSNPAGVTRDPGTAPAAGCFHHRAGHGRRGGLGPGLESSRSQAASLKAIGCRWSGCPGRFGAAPLATGIEALRRLHLLPVCAGSVPPCSHRASSIEAITVLPCFIGAGWPHHFPLWWRWRRRWRVMSSTPIVRCGHSRHRGA